jgi:hypothetical protein
MPRILAEGVSRLVDNVDRGAFDNWAEYEALYGHLPGIAEMLQLRAKAVPMRIMAMFLDARPAARRRIGAPIRRTLICAGTPGGGIGRRTGRDADDSRLSWRRAGGAVGLCWWSSMRAVIRAAPVRPRNGHGRGHTRRARVVDADCRSTSPACASASTQADAPEREQNCTTLGFAWPGTRRVPLPVWSRSRPAPDPRDRDRYRPRGRGLLDE